VFQVNLVLPATVQRSLNLQVSLGTASSNTVQLYVK
jgi:uncharacterized protein (TIGR03437 family)